MRIGLSTLLLLVTIAALVIAIASMDSKPDFVTIEKHADIWLLSDEQFARSLWKDRSKPPPLSQAEALETANKIVDDLASHEDKFRFEDLLLESVSLVRIQMNKQAWAYQIFISACSDGQRGSPELSFLLFMDGTLAFNPNEYWPELNQVIRRFETKNGVEFVDSMYE